ncbi:MAG: hypothetical protein K8L91_20070 [Anaerolineae bacterium]|nr:hypothetical protein [Anaerolineae bacterium]
MAKRRRRTHDYAEEPLEKPTFKPKDDYETDTQSDRANNSAGNILQLHQSHGNQYVMRVLGGKQPADTATLTLKDVFAIHLVPAIGSHGLSTLLRAIRVAPISERESFYNDASNRAKIRDVLPADDAKAVFGALLKDPPYIPGDLSEQYRSLDKSEKATIDDKANKQLEAETDVTGPLDWSKLEDKPFARRWLRIRDTLVEKLIAEKVTAALKEWVIELAASGDKATLAFTLDSLDKSEQLALRSDKTFMEKLRDNLAWNDFADCVQILGRRALTGEELKDHPNVIQQLNEAWDDSLPMMPPATSKDDIESGNHEEGGWIYLNLVTGKLEFKKADKLRIIVRGGTPPEMAIDLSLPPTLDDAVIIANYHIHPNEPGVYAEGPSGDDFATIDSYGIPGLMKDWKKVWVYGSVPMRLKLSGNRTYPMF